METNRIEDKLIEPAKELFYHGTKAQLKTGDLIAPGFQSN